MIAHHRGDYEGNGNNVLQTVNLIDLGLEGPEVCKYTILVVEGVLCGAVLIHH